MAYVFNNGRGGVICDDCRVLIDQDIGWVEYNAVRKLGPEGQDWCMKCGEKHRKRETLGVPADVGCIEGCVSCTQERVCRKNK